jgi:hypothetical protein
MFADGVLADTVDELKTRVPELIENFRNGFFGYPELMVKTR